MTTDTPALQERIARALYENAEYYGPAPTQPPWDWRDDEERGEWMEIAAAVLPIIAAEVRKAQAGALREAAENVDVGSLADAWTHGTITRLSVTNAVAEVLMSLRNRATEYETGDRA